LPLLERRRELVLLDGLLDGVATGHGGAAIIEGVAGVGKTRLLSTMSERARGRGALVLFARASEFEDGFPFGVVRQLFEPVLRTHEDPHRLLRGAELAGELLLREPGRTHETTLSAAGDVVFGLLHSLYWLVVNLSDAAPVLILVDDLQWADEPSQRFVGFCGARLAEVPVGLVVTNRGGAHDPQSPTQMLARLPDLVDIRPAPLSRDGVARLLHDALGTDAADDFVEACRVATGGVPFYARELAYELAREGIEPSAANALRVAEVRPESLVRTVVARVAGLPEPSMRVARALAVLGGHAEPGEVAAVAAVDMSTAGQAQQQLSRAGIVESGRFAFQHPIIGGSVYGDTPPVERQRLHANAAAVLRAAGVPSDRVAAQLLRASPSGEAGAVEVLRSAAKEAMARGAPADAVPLLRRALAEPPEPALRPRVLLELGTAALSAGAVTDAITYLRAALDIADPSLRGRAALALGRALGAAARMEEAATLADALAEELEVSDPELALRLELDFLVAGSESAATAPLVFQRLPRIAPKADTSTPTRRLLLAWLAAHGIGRNQPARLAADRARRALGSGDLIEAEPPDSVIQWFAPIALIMADDYVSAERALAQLAAAAQRHGSIGGLVSARILSAMLGFHRGALPDAEADATEALVMTRDYPGIRPVAASWAVQVAIERGALDLAEQVLAEQIPTEATTTTGFYLQYRYAHALLQLARHRWQEGLGELLSLGRQATRYEWISPAGAPWLSRAALAALALGDRGRAGELADQELRLAEAFGAPRALGVALHAAGLVAGDQKGVALLERAADVLAGHGVNLVQARVLTDLGAMLRRGGAIRAARDRLSAGLDLAVRCGAHPLVEHARQELTAAGARPRRSAVAGVEALTGAERRVSHLATDGLSNREIAQALFVTVKTVELHLTNSYRKLGVPGRSQLRAALGPRR
jgi:DNA-binding CsgD family transcriptional regulator